MASESLNPVCDIPTTSTHDQYDFSLDKAVEIFQQMVIAGPADEECTQKEQAASKATKDPPHLKVSHSSDKSRTPKVRYRYRYTRWTPYFVPRKFVRQRGPCCISIVRTMLKNIRWRDDVDVDGLKYSLLEKKSLPCGVEAARPPSPDVEVEELAEYFSHFVRVDLKMSALAESMYC